MHPGMKPGIHAYPPPPHAPRYPTFREEAPVDLLQAFVGLLLPRAFLDPAALRALASDSVPVFLIWA